MEAWMKKNEVMLINKPIDLNPEAVKGYLDRCIAYWRGERDKHIEVDSKALHYIDAFQCVRISLFGELKGD